MTLGAGQPFELSQTPGALQDVRILADRARKRGSTQWLADVLRTIVLDLKTNPTGWGDPLFRPRSRGVVSIVQSVIQ